MLGGETTLRGDRGLFLDSTWRMHPEVCRFISEVVYEDRLRSRPGCKLQLVGGGDLLSGAGVRHLPVEHVGNRTESVEEAAVVAETVRALAGRRWTDFEGRQRALTLQDIVVVAPYNAQVALLKRRLPASVRDGTVDKFQGQEAPVSIYSMASSSGDDVPRGMEFLFSLNRLNVAMSRARSLAILVCSSALIAVPGRTPAQIRLANALCRLAAMASTTGPRPPPVPR